jgi:serine/threonine protein kinase
MIYELLVGVTPFHSYEMKDLIAKINDGRYKLTLQEPICVETCLFLIQCMQMNEGDRIPVEELTEHPYICEALMSTPLTSLDIEAFNNDMLASSRHFSGFDNTGGSNMTSRFEDTVILDTDVVLTTKASDQVRILLGQLVNSTNFKGANFEMSDSTYFMKHYDVSM